MESERKPAPNEGASRRPTMLTDWAPSPTRGGPIRLGVPRALIAMRSAAAAVLVAAGLLTGSVILGAVGVAIGLWAIGTVVRS